MIYGSSEGREGVLPIPQRNGLPRQIITNVISNLFSSREGAGEHHKALLEGLQGVSLHVLSH